MEQLTNEQIDELHVRLTYFATDNCQLETSKKKWAADIAKLCAQARANIGELTSPEYISRLRGVMGRGEVALAALRRLNLAIAALGKIKDGKTLFEIRPSQDEETLDAWLELSAAQKLAKQILDASPVAGEVKG